MVNGSKAAHQKKVKIIYDIVTLIIKTFSTTKKHRSACRKSGKHSDFDVMELIAMQQDNPQQQQTMLFWISYDNNRFLKIELPLLMYNLEHPCFEKQWHHMIL